MTSQRFQSQFFNFVARQTQKLADKTATVLRHAKVTAIWGTQILLYPVYALFQSTRLVGRQIGQTIEKTLLQLRWSREEIDSKSGDLMVKSDAPVQRVLTAVKRALISGGNLPVLRDRPLMLIRRLLPFSEPETLIPANPYQIQGIASAIDTRSLVLILEGNVILDILTPEQQQQIEHRIRLELARYWQWRRKLYLKSAPLSLPDDRETLLPPIRVFRQLMAWIQISPVAIATNLFHESTSTCAKGNTPQSELDWFRPSVPLSAWSPTHLVPTVPDRKAIAAWVVQLPNWTDLEALIWAAIHYFFGNKTRLASAQATLPEAVSRLPSFTDVFGKKLPGRDSRQILGRVHPAVEPQSILEGANTVRTLPQQPLMQWSTTIRQQIQRLLRKLSGTIVVQKHSAPGDLTVSTGIEPGALNTIKPELAGAIDRGVVVESTITATQPGTPTVAVPILTDVEPAFDWIETPATHVEYVLSPWQKFLRWLDASVLWIEQRLTAIWQWLTRR